MKCIILSSRKDIIVSCVLSCNINRENKTQFRDTTVDINFSNSIHSNIEEKNCVEIKIKLNVIVRNYRNELNKGLIPHTKPVIGPMRARFDNTIVSI